MKQSTSNLILIRPFKFFSNPETSINNYFQDKSNEKKETIISKQALFEFDNFIKVLKKNDLNIYLFSDTENPITPDSLFPNNWFSTYYRGDIHLHSMFAKNRRLEKRIDVIDLLKENFIVNNIFDKTKILEEKNQFLEGTGSLVLDRVNRIAYAALSERTNKFLLLEFCKQINFRPVYFTAYQNFENKKIIYHTNVMMSVASKYVIICLDSIINKKERNDIINCIEKSEKKIIPISLDQVNNFCGNVIELNNNNNHNLLVMSTKAFNSFSNSQIKTIENFSKIVHSPLDTIEKYGGGGARCMIAEIFLNKK
ncbi:MAG: amidinotransferase [Flavobacteriales bacterium]|nr:amidinotransferase [Flavobacteriales bacterium]